MLPETLEVNGLTIRQINKKYPQKLVMVSREFGEPIFIGPLNDMMRHTPVYESKEAVIWSVADTLSDIKLKMARFETGLDLKYEELNNF